MQKHCGLSKLFAFAAAALFCLTMAAPQSRADSISVGTGVLTLCWNGVSAPCDFNGDQPNVSFTDVNGQEQISIHIAGNPDGPGAKDLTDPLFVIFAVPVENLLYPFDPSGVTFGPRFNTTTGTKDLTKGLGGSIDDVQLFEGYNPATSDLPTAGVGNCCPPDGAIAGDATLGHSLPDAGDLHYLGNVFTGGTAPFKTQGQVYGPSDKDFFGDFLSIDGVAGGSDSTFADWAVEMFDTPEWLAKNKYLGPDGAGLLPDNNKATIDGFVANLLGNHPSPCKLSPPSPNTVPDDKCVDGFFVWIYEVDASNGNHHFGTGDTINVVTSGFPLGTIVSALGLEQDCDINDPTGGCILAPPDSKKAILMPFAPGTPEVPEPTSLLLLGTGLLGIGRQWRKRQQSRKQNVV